MVLSLWGLRVTQQRLSVSDDLTFWPIKTVAMVCTAKRELRSIQVSQLL